MDKSNPLSHTSLKSEATSSDSNIDDSITKEWHSESGQLCDANEKQTMYPAVPFYGSCNIKDQLKPGDIKLWCTCGLSEKQPWCDRSHVGTGFKPLKWTVEKNQTMH